MPAEYVMGYRKPPVSGRFQKEQSGNPAGRPKPRPRPTRRQRFAQMLEAGLMEPVEKLATTPTRSTIAAWAKGMALDGVRGKTAMMRLAFFLWDELDVMEGNLEPRRRARRVRLPEEVEAVEDARGAFENEQETYVPVHPVSQRVIEEGRLPMCGEYTGEAPGYTSSASPPNVSRPARAGRPDEAGTEDESEKKTHLDGEPQSAGGWVARSSLHSGRAFARTGVAGHDMGGDLGTGTPTATSPLSEGNEQGAKAESERSYLVEAARSARKPPNEKEQSRLAGQAEIERQRQAYVSAVAKVKAFAEKRGYEFREWQCGNRPENAPSPLSEGKPQGTIDPHPEEGPNKRALRQRFERIAAADSMEAERKAALAMKAVPLTRALSPAPTPRLRRTSEHSGPAEALAKAGRSGGEGDRAPESLPDYAIWMRGQRAPP